MNTRDRVIAVVDDDSSLLESLEDLLKSAGYGVRAFSSPLAFLASNEDWAIDCLITDIGLPGMDGFELRELAKRERPDLPVILITGRIEIAEQRRSRDPAIRNDIFRKPFNSQALLDAVARALEAGKPE